MTEATQDPPDAAAHGASDAQTGQDGEEEEDQNKAKSHTPVEDGKANRSPRKRRKVNHGRSLPTRRCSIWFADFGGYCRSACIYCRRSVSLCGLPQYPFLVALRPCFTAGLRIWNLADFLALLAYDNSI